MGRGVRAPVRFTAVVLAVAILTIQCGDLPDEGDVAGVELVNNTDADANLVVQWFDDGKTAQDVALSADLPGEIWFGSGLTVSRFEFAAASPSHVSARAERRRCHRGVTPIWR